MNGMTTPGGSRGALTDVSFTKFRQRAEEPGIGGTMMSLTKLQHDGIEVRHASYPTASGRVKVGGTMMSLPTTTKWQQERHHDSLP